MSLIQRNAVPLFILLAVAAAGVGAFLFGSSFVFGEEPEGCDAAAVGASIYTTDANGNPVTVVKDGDVVIYRVTLSIPELPEGETACNYQGGTLSITLPNETVVLVAGPDKPEGGIPTVQVGSPFTAESVEYTVDGNDAVNGELTVRANYEGGSSLSVAEGEVAPEASATVSNVLRMTPPSIAIEKITTTPIIFYGQSASFNITVINTGGFALSGVTVSDAQVAACDGLDFGDLAVGEEKTQTCETTLDGDLTNEAQATATVVGGALVDTVTSEVGSATVNVEGLEIGIIVETNTPHIRVGNQGDLVITVTMPPQTPVNNVQVTVPEAPQCDNFWDSLQAGATESYTCALETDPAVEGALALGTTTMNGTVVGDVPDVPLTASDSTDVSVFNALLNITITPKEQTIRDGYMADFTVTVSNQGDEALSNVIVTNETAPNCDMTFETLEPQAVETYPCTSEALSADLTTTVNAVATAADNQEVTATDSADVIILFPSTAIEISSVNTMMVKLVVQTLKITETNDGDSPLTNVCVELDRRGDILPMTPADDGMMEGEGMAEGDGMEEGMAEGEGMGEGEAMASDPCAMSADPDIMILTKNSVEYVGGDINDDGMLNEGALLEDGTRLPGETWEWRVVVMGIAGDYVQMGPDAQSMKFVAVGHGIDILGDDVTYPDDVEELGEVEVPIMAP